MHCGGVIKLTKTRKVTPFLHYPFTKFGCASETNGVLHKQHLVGLRRARFTCRLSYGLPAQLHQRATMTRRILRLIPVFAAAFASLTASQISARGEERKSIRVGYALSLTGVNVGGAGALVRPNYRMWVAEVNDAGGIVLSRIGKRLPIEIIEYDDESTA